MKKLLAVDFIFASIFLYYVKQSCWILEHNVDFGHSILLLEMDFL